MTDTYEQDLKTSRETIALAIAVARTGWEGCWDMAWHLAKQDPLMFKGRGIKHLGTLRADHLTEQAQHKAGWNEYTVTERALDKLAERFTFAREALLD